MSCMQSLARRDVSPPNMMMFMAGCERSFFRRLLAALLPTLISAEAKACIEEFVAHASAMCMTIECKMNRVYTRHIKHNPLDVQVTEKPQRTFRVTRSATSYACPV